MTSLPNIPDEAIEAAAEALWTPNENGDTWAGEFSTYRDYLKAEARKALEAAAPHFMAEYQAKLDAVTQLAEQWHARGEHDMAFSKTIADEDISIAILTEGASMVENARHIRNALSAGAGE